MNFVLVGLALACAVAAYFTAPNENDADNPSVVTRNTVGTLLAMTAIILVLLAIAL